MQSITFGTCLLDSIEAAGLAPTPGSLANDFFVACGAAQVGPWRALTPTRYGLDVLTVSNYLIANGLPPLVVWDHDQFWYPHPEALGHAAILIDVSDNHARAAKLVHIVFGPVTRARAMGSANYAAPCTFAHSHTLDSSNGRGAGRGRAHNAPRVRSQRALPPRVPRVRRVRRGERPPRRLARGAAGQRALRPVRDTRVVAAPSAYSSASSARNSVPFHYAGKEALGTVSPTGLNLAVAASSPVTFPMGYRVMNTFARYRVTRLRFSYEPSVGTATAGTVWLAFSPTPFAEPVVFEDITTAASVASGPVWAPIHIDVRYEPTQRWLLNYNSTVWNYKSPDYNLGMLYVFMAGVAGDAPVGIVNIDYSVALVDRARTLPNLAGPPALLALQAPQGQLDQRADSAHRVPPASKAQLDLPEPQEHKDLREPQESLDFLVPPEL